MRDFMRFLSFSLPVCCLFLLCFKRLLCFSHNDFALSFLVQSLPGLETCLALSKEVGLTVPVCNCSCIRIVPHQRWGNNLLQILKACQIAEHLGLARVKVAYNFAFIRKPLPWTAAVAVFPERDTFESCFTAKFFNLARGHKIPLRLEFPALFKRAYRKQLDIAQLEDSLLAVHMRSGDIFSRWIHRRYAQPPCSYYRDVARFHPWKKILVFSEDFKNPCIRKVADNVSLHVGGCLLDELRLLLGARNLAIGRGTFGLMVALLSEDLLRLYTFNQSSGLQCALRATAISNCQPSLTFYRENMLYWRKTKEQLRLMFNSTCESWASGNVVSDFCPVDPVMIPLSIT